MTLKAISLCVGWCALVGLAACNGTSNPVPISPQAEAALPDKTKIEDVRRLSNGCYFIVDDRGLSGFYQPLVTADGRQVCDPVLLEQMFNPDRTVVNERAI